MNTHVEFVEIVHGNCYTEALEWLQDDSSGADGFILVESRKKKKEGKTEKLSEFLHQKGKRTKTKIVVACRFAVPPAVCESLSLW